MRPATRILPFRNPAATVARLFAPLQAGGLAFELQVYPGPPPNLPAGSLVAPAIDGKGGCVVLAPIGEAAP